MISNLLREKTPTKAPFKLNPVKKSRNHPRKGASTRLTDNHTGLTHKDMITVDLGMQKLNSQFSERPLIPETAPDLKSSIIIEDGQENWDKAAKGVEISDSAGYSPQAWIPDSPLPGVSFSAIVEGLGSAESFDDSKNEKKKSIKMGDA